MTGHSTNSSRSSKSRWPYFRPDTFFSEVLNAVSSTEYISERNQHPTRFHMARRSILRLSQNFIKPQRLVISKSASGTKYSKIVTPEILERDIAATTTASEKKPLEKRKAISSANVCMYNSTSDRSQSHQHQSPSSPASFLHTPV